MPKTETNIIVKVDGKPMANCAGVDVAALLATAISEKISNAANFEISVQKQTIQYPDEPEKPEEPEVEVVKEHKKK